jgi:ubiquinone/menaquinone biosynthesis C-methylase UbiE
VSPEPGPPADHYSYALYADPAVAEGFDRARFGGPIGALLAEEQAALLRAFAGSGGEALDVGTGTGRAAIVLAEAGARVTAVDASAEMLRVARGRVAGRDLPIRFAQGDAHRLEFADGSFDTVVSLRVLMHTPDWRRCLGELCRVSRGRVIIDYPAARSAAALQSAARRIAHALGLPTEPYRVFTDAQIRRELSRHGFRVVRRHRQFVLPIALHKRIGSPRFTTRGEAALARAGLRALLGSPVTVLAER